MYHICHMAQQTETKDEWTSVRIRVTLIEDVKGFVKRNPVFDNPAQVIDAAVKQFLERGYK